MSRLWLMRLRVGILAVLLVVVMFVSAACGGASGGTGSGSGGSNASGLAPATVFGFATVNTDWGSSQIADGSAVLDKFPFHTQLIASLKRSIGSDGTDVAKLQSSVGPEVDVAILKAGGTTSAVGFTKPKDVAGFVSTLGAATKHEQIDGWTVFSSSQAALDAVKNRTGNLSDSTGYQAAEGALPGDALATAYVDRSAFALIGSTAARAVAGAGAAVGKGLSVGPSSATGALDATKLDWLSAAVTAHDSGIELQVHLHSTVAPAGSSSSSNDLSGEIPSGALVAASFDGSGASGTLAQAGGSATSTLGPMLQQALGVNLKELLAAVNGPVIAFAKAGTPLPEVTLAAKPADAAAAAATVKALISKLAKGAAPTAVAVDGATLDRFAVGALSVFVGTFDGQLVVSDSQQAVSELKGSGGKLSDDGVFKDAKSASGLPGSSQGWLYVDLKDSIPTVEAFAGLAGQKIPAQVDGDLKPLRSLIAYATRDGQTQTVVVFLQTN